MIDKLLVDTGAFISREIRQDQHHAVAAHQWQQLGDSAIALFLTEHVFDETLTLLARRTSYAFAAEWGASCLQSREFEWLRPEEDDLKTALGFMRKFADQGVSFTDCISFALMRREGIKYAFSFDRHFIAAQFRLWVG